MTEEKRFIVQFDKDRKACWIYDSFDKGYYMRRSFPPVMDRAKLTTYRVGLYKLCNLLNEQDNFKQDLIRILKDKYKIARILRTPMTELEVGQDKGYWNGVKSFIDEICEELRIDLDE